VVVDANQSPNILIVDDEKYICNIIVEALASEDCNCVSISDPSSALEYIHNNQVDLVLSDLVMGEYSGVQILEATLAEHQDAVVILMTAHPTVQTAVSVLKAGAYDFLVKPFKLEMLRATIRRGLAHQQILRENMHLKAQVEFLKVAGAAGADVDINEFMAMVARSARKETDAVAVGIIAVDPKSGETLRTTYEGKRDQHRSVVLDESVVEAFKSGRVTRPKVHVQRLQDGVEPLARIFISQPIVHSRHLHGVINVLVMTRFNHITQGQMSILSILAGSAGAAMANQRLYRDLKTSYLQAIRGLANSIEARDECTAGHTDRVCRLAEMVARRLKWDERRLEHLVMGCTLHDIGKIGVPDRILNKPDRLTDEERARMMAHPEVGLMIIDGIDLFRPAIPYIIAHHEWYDGTGYPNGLTGEEIPVEGRLLAVVDTFDAILSDRPYRKGASVRQAVSELVKFSGTQFDPEIVKALVEILLDGSVDFKSMFGREENVEEIRELLPTEKAQA
jgi:response regulator RpfG family c-di-GMP phosphodiesterase